MVAAEPGELKQLDGRARDFSPCKTKVKIASLPIEGYQTKFHIALLGVKQTKKNDVFAYENMSCTTVAQWGNTVGIIHVLISQVVQQKIT